MARRMAVEFVRIRLDSTRTPMPAQSRALNKYMSWAKVVSHPRSLLTQPRRPLMAAMAAAAAPCLLAPQWPPALTRRKRASAFGDDEEEKLKRGRFSPGLAAQRPALAAFDPLGALRLIFPGADPRDLEACLAASGRDVHATVAAYRAAQAREAAGARLASAARAADGGGVDECAAVLVEQMAAAADVADATSRASWALALVMDAAAERAAAALREENAALRARAAALERGGEELRRGAAALQEGKAALERENEELRRGAAAQQKALEAAARDTAVLKHGVLAKHARLEEAERTAAELSKKVVELGMANYALGVRLRDADRQLPLAGVLKRSH
ncbi:hypothetical protein ACP4OV_021623 [Aristida adscensionis]